MTLGTMAIIRNAGYIMTKGQAAYPTKLDIYMASAKGYIGIFPIPVIIILPLVLYNKFTALIIELSIDLFSFNKASLCSLIFCFMEFN